MAQNTVGPAALSCSVCLKDLKVPITIPCGHSYCSSCIRDKLLPFLEAAMDELRPEPSCREDFLRYARDITLDPNTANKHLSLSDGNRSVKYGSEEQNHPDHPDRFSEEQVLSPEELTGRCYWELEWSGRAVIAAAYKDTERDCLFGHDEKSWALDCIAVNPRCHSFGFNKVWSEIPGPVAYRIGVYLDHSAGALSFYSIEGETMRLLHRFQTQFTQPLHAGVYTVGNAHFLKLK